MGFFVMSLTSGLLVPKRPLKPDVSHLSLAAKRMIRFDNSVFEAVEADHCKAPSRNQ